MRVGRALLQAATCRMCMHRSILCGGNMVVRYSSMAVPHWGGGDNAGVFHLLAGCMVRRLLAASTT